MPIPTAPARNTGCGASDRILHSIPSSQGLRTAYTFSLITAAPFSEEHVPSLVVAGRRGSPPKDSTKPSEVTANPMSAMPSPSTDRRLPPAYDHEPEKSCDSNEGKRRQNQTYWRLSWQRGRVKRALREKVSVASLGVASLLAAAHLTRSNGAPRARVEATDTEACYVGYVGERDALEVSPGLGLQRGSIE